MTSPKNQSPFEINTFKPVQGTFEQCWGFLYYNPPGAEKYDDRLINRKTANFYLGHSALVPKKKSIILIQLWPPQWISMNSVHQSAP